MLYTPAHFSAPAAADAVALVRAYPFATLLSVDGGQTQLTHLPLLWRGGRDGGPDTLEGHMARANPHWQAFADGRTTAIFQGPHAYVSPAGYADPAREVPTWNYAVAHIHGRPALVDDPERKLALIDRAIAAFEAVRPEPWTRALQGARLDALLRNIVAFEIRVERIEAKFKMSQNRTAADRAGVIRQLEAGADPQAHAVARWMREHE
ncbi:MAG: FMN-binding negative transcriptional regulator [Nevskiales bacterium]|nr:FMN-binding negative transcriptional regulator [Nevskiales bacterium]